MQAVLYSNLSLFKYFGSDFDNAITLANKSLNLIDQSDLVEERRVSVSRLALGILKSCYSAFGEHEKCVEKAQQILSLVTKTQPNSSAHANALIELEIAEYDAYGIINLKRIDDAEQLASSVGIFYLPQILWVKSKALVLKGLFIEAQQILNESLTRSVGLGLTRWQFQCNLLQAELFYLTDKVEEAKQLCLDLYIQVRKEAHNNLIYRTLQLIAKIEQSLGNFEKAESYLVEALTYIIKKQNITGYLSIRVSQYQLYQETNSKRIDEQFQNELLIHIEKIDFADRSVLKNHQQSQSLSFID